ncbi:MAG TPA: GH25 family lysozyme [Terriglobales bacterium]|nr:GH25 family lysozyme [Terriglobales bacterium]
MVETNFVRGIDVSHYQGVIDWEQVANAGVEFAFIKATDGVTVDSIFAANWKAAKMAGLRRGAYHFFRAAQDVERQAKRFIAQVNDDWGELPAVLDFEVLGEVSIAEAVQGVAWWMKLVEAASGKIPVLYTGPAFWQTQAKDSDAFCRHGLWIAHYTAAAQPSLPSAWKQWTFWQHSEQGSVPGVKGPVDLDRFYGNAMELEALGQRISIKSATIGN